MAAGQALNLFRSKPPSVLVLFPPSLIDREDPIPEGRSLSSHFLRLQNEGMPEAQIGAAMVALLQAMAEIRKRRYFFGEVVVTSDNIRYDPGDICPFKLLNRTELHGGDRNPRLGLFGLGIVAIKMAFGATDWEAVQLKGVDDPHKLLLLRKGFRKVWAEKVKGKRGQVSVGVDGPRLLSNTEQADLRYLELKKGNDKLQARIRRLIGKRKESGAGIALSPEFVDFVIKLLDWDHIKRVNPRSISSLESHRFLKNYI